jgi:DNA-binding MarR family transcriptional regulator
MIYNDFILKDTRLNSTDKLVYGLIGVLSNQKGYCYATNDYVAKQLNLKPRTITDSISKLKKSGYIRTENTNHQRHIYLCDIEE